MNETTLLKALADENRLQVLKWLKSPRLHFQTAQSDVVKVGVCSGQIQKKLGLSQPSTSRHLAILERAELVTITKIGQWRYYKRNNKVICDFNRTLKQNL